MNKDFIEKTSTVVKNSIRHRHQREVYDERCKTKKRICWIRTNNNQSREFRWYVYIQLNLSYLQWIEYRISQKYYHIKWEHWYWQLSSKVGQKERNLMSNQIQKQRKFIISRSETEICLDNFDLSKKLWISNLR